MKKLILIFALVYEMCFGLSFSVAPTGFNLDLNKKATEEVYLINNTSQPLRLEVYLEAPKGYEKNNLNNYITVFPKIISIKPGSKQSVRFRVKTDENIKENTRYKSLLVFRERPNEIKNSSQNDSNNISKDNISKKEEGFSANLIMITEVAIPITGQKSIEKNK